MENVPRTLLVADHNLDQSPEARAKRDPMLPRNLLCLKVKSLKIFEIAPWTSENGNRDKENWDDQAEEVGHKVSERKMAGLFGK